MNRTIVLGLVLALIIGAIVYLEAATSNGLGIERVELNASTPAVRDGNETDAQMSAAERARERIARKSIQYPKAVELQGIDGYLNAENFTLQEYVGEKVILIDFWTYSCINCQRTFPYLNAWWEEYEDDGLLIVGVHAPEFEFEKDVENVKRAIERFGIEYPVVLDNEMATWRAYNNRYWPRKYLIDIDGFIVYDHIGEGDYGETELMIRRALEERGQVRGLNASLGNETDVSAVSADFGRIGTRELYLGYGYERDQLGNDEGFVAGETVNYSLPDEREPSTFYLNDSWRNEHDFMHAVSNARIALEYTARQVNIVAGAQDPANVSVYVDGSKVSELVIDEETLYTLVDAEGYGTHDLVLRIDPGVRVYTFTFG